MGISLDPRDPSAMGVLRTFAAWSTNVETYDEVMHWVAEFSDTSHAVCFNATEQELQRIRAAVGDLPISPIRSADP